MKIIKLRLVNGTSVRVNPDYIQYYRGEAGKNEESCTWLMLKDEPLKVKETPKQIDEKIAELPTSNRRSIFEDIFGPVTWGSGGGS